MTESTGNAAIDEALARLADLEEQPIEQHPGAFEQLHKVLRDALSQQSSESA